MVEYHIARLMSITGNIMGFAVVQVPYGKYLGSAEVSARKMFLNYMGFKDVKEYNKLYPGHLKHVSKNVQTHYQPSYNRIKNKDIYKDFLDVFIDGYEYIEKFSWMKNVVRCLYDQHNTDMQVYPKMEDIRKIDGCSSLEKEKLWFCEDWDGEVDT